MNFTKYQHVATFINLTYVILSDIDTLFGAIAMQNSAYEEWMELTEIMNVYMITHEWTATDALNFMKGVMVKTAKVTGIKKHIFEKQIESMKKDFDNYSDNIPLPTSATRS